MRLLAPIAMGCRVLFLCQFLCQRPQPRGAPAAQESASLRRKPAALLPRRACPGMTSGDARLLRRWCFREGGQHPDLPTPALNNVHSSPATRDIQWLAAWVLTGDAVFADSDPRISADLQHLISLYLRLIKSGLEGALVRLGDVRLRSRRQDQHAAVRIELRN